MFAECRIIILYLNLSSDVTHFCRSSLIIFRRKKKAFWRQTTSGLFVPFHHSKTSVWTLPQFPTASLPVGRNHYRRNVGKENASHSCCIQSSVLVSFPVDLGTITIWFSLFYCFQSIASAVKGWNFSPYLDIRSVCLCHVWVENYALSTHQVLPEYFFPSLNMID